VLVGANAVVETDAQIGDDTRLLAGVVVHHRVQIGTRCIIHAGAVVGADGFGNARDGSGAWTKVPQLGRVIVGDDVEIGANTTIDRGAIGDTRIGDGVRLDNLVHIPHNLEIGEHTAIAAQSGSAGSTRIGARCMFGGHVGIADHIEIGDDIVVLGGTMVTGSLTKPGAYGGPATGAEEVATWRRNAVRFRQLDDIARRLKQLERAQRNKHAAD
jgi:UDP-3-O-[3-hydroxymyristoyl] glucosamine N-acyltransferase